MLLLRDRLEKARDTKVIPFAALQDLLRFWTMLYLLVIDAFIENCSFCLNACRNLFIDGLLSALLLRAEVSISLDECTFLK